MKTLFAGMKTMFSLVETMFRGVVHHVLGGRNRVTVSVKCVLGGENRVPRRRAAVRKWLFLNRGGHGEHGGRNRGKFWLLKSV